MTARARCFCGAVGVDVEWPSKWVAHCHCTMCQRAHGAGVVTWVGMERERCTLVDDAHQLRWYDSSPGAQRGFCAVCGTTLFFRSERWPGELHVVRSNFIDPVDREPSVHTYWSSHAEWLRLDPDDGLKRER